MAEENGATPVDEVIVDAPIVGENTLEPETPAEPKSMDDTIRETLRSLKSKGEEIPQETAPEDAEQKAARIRDAQGKFAKAEKPVETPVDTPVAAPEPPVVIPQEVQRLGFRKEAAEAYAAAPDVLKQEIQRRSDEWHKGRQADQPKIQFADTMERTIAPYRQTLDQLQIKPEAAVGQLMMADQRLRGKDIAFFSHLADQYGFDRNQLAQVFGGQVQVQNAIDPNVAYLSQQVEQLRGYQQQQETMRAQAEQETLNSEIQRFAADPNHSHFESVKGHMSALLQAGQAKDLTDAYEQAIYANPQTRALVIAKQQADAKAEATKKAQAAKAVASVNVKTRPSLPPSTPIGSMDDTIRQTLRRLQAQA